MVGLFPGVQMCKAFVGAPVPIKLLVAVWRRAGQHGTMPRALASLVLVTLLSPYPVYHTPK